MIFLVPGTLRTKPRPHHGFEDLEPIPPTGSALRTFGLCVAGWLVGYLISMVSSILFFLIGHIKPHEPASTTVMWVTAVYGIVFAVAGSVTGASFSRGNALGIGAAIAFTIGVAGIWSWYETPKDAHWSQAIAILLMAPAAQFGAFFRRPSD